MVHATWARFVALLLLCCFVNLVVAGRWDVLLHRRDEPTISSTAVNKASSTQSTKPSQTASSSGEDGASTTQKSGGSVATISPTANSTSSSAATATQASVTPLFSNINGGSSTSGLNLNYTGYNSTLTPNKLPITPVITPAYAVAGVIFIASGVSCSLIGIKKKWLHIIVSAAYLTILAVSVLILYVMNPPINNAVQGAYLTAAVIAGAMIGGAAFIFQDMAEGLGCLLGGFCFSMWLLVLKPGGLLSSTGGKSGLIAALTVSAYMTSFYRPIRPYSIIACTSFAGATIIVLGIDCFSRAGLKEFWAYLWALNPNLFPLGATTYPLTRGIRVELAAIVVCFLFGVVSQMKLWMIIKERRDQRAADRSKEERNIEQEEENVGRRIEDANAEERGQWEAVYGNKESAKSINPSNRDSGLGDMDSQKKGPTSTVTGSMKGEETIEMTDLSASQTPAGLVTTSKDGGLTVRVARDVEPTPELDEFGIPAIKSRSLASPRNSTSQRPEEEAWIVGADGEARLERRASKRQSVRNSNVVPEVVPLPFKVPDGDFPDDRSSVATFADEDPAAQKRRSRHLSAGSMILRRLSQRSVASLRSPRSPRSNRNSRNFTIGEGPSTEEIIPQGPIDDDRASSLAATMDGLSDDEDMRSVRSEVFQAPDTTEVAGPAQESEMSPVREKFAAINMDEATPEAVKTPSDAHTVVGTAEGDEAKAESVAKESVGIPQSLTTSTDPKPSAESVATPEVQKAERKKADSFVSAVDSKPSSITKDRLPAQMSRVVMSYRTNEWAKHLSLADSPDLEELKLAEYPVGEQHSAVKTEVPVPVKVEELQQTAESVAAPPSRSHSQMSNHPAPTRSNSAMSKHVPSPLERSDSAASNYPPETLSRSMSQHSLSSMKNGNNSSLPRGLRSVSGPVIPQPIVESPIEAEYPSHSPNMPSTGKFPAPNVPYGTPGTLIGKRDSMLRQKYNPPATLSSTPENPSWKFPNAVAGPSSNPSLPASYGQYPSGPVSVRAESDAGSIYNYPNTNAIMYDDDDENMSLSARRELIRQSSLHQSSSSILLAGQTPPLQSTPGPFDSHQPRRQPSGPSPMAREQQLASWRASVQHELQASGAPRNTIERQRSQLWSERQQHEASRALEERKRQERDGQFDERMRRGDMLDAHREALRKMQASANKHA